MSAQRFLRASTPLMRAIERQPMAFRAAALASRNIGTSKKNSWFAAPPAPGKNMTPLKAAMPQLEPFYFVNEVAYAFTLLPLLIYVFSKYILPQRLRLFATRLFVSKL